LAANDRHDSRVHLIAPTGASGQGHFGPFSFSVEPLSLTQPNHGVWVWMLEARQIKELEETRRGPGLKEPRSGGVNRDQTILLVAPPLRASSANPRPAAAATTADREPPAIRLARRAAGRFASAWQEQGIAKKWPRQKTASSRFLTTQRRSARNEVGLGLAIARSIIELHGGPAGWIRSPAKARPSISPCRSLRRCRW
jgi:hypothetical protein